MAAFLKIVSGLYLVIVWLAFAGVTSTTTPLNASVGSDGVKILAFLCAVGLSIPAAVLFGFAQIVGDIRIMRNNARLQGEHLAAMRRYYEPTR
jgi:hypothetical protein